MTSMNNRALIINGAIRVKGNTDTLISKIIEGSTDTGVNVDFVTLREKKVGNCIGCYQCLKEATCSIQDDLTEIRDCIQEAQLLIFASPLY